MNQRLLLKHQTWSLAATILTGVIGIGTMAMVVRLLGVEGYGAVGLTVGVGSMVGMLQNFGISAATSREVAQAESRAAIPKIILSSLLFRLMVSLPLVCGLFLLAEWIAVDLYQRPYIEPLIRLSALLLLVQELFSVFDATLRGLQRFRAFALLKPLAAVIRLGSLYFCIRAWSVSGWFLGEILCYTVLLAIQSALILQSLRWRVSLPSTGEIQATLRRIWDMSFVVFFTKIAITSWLRAPILLLGFVGGDAQLGVLALGLQLGSRYRTITASVAAVNLPFLSRLYRESREHFGRIFQRNLELIFALLCVLLAGVFALQKEVVPLLFGKDFLQVTEFLPLLLLVFLSMQLVNLIGSGALYPTGHFRNLAWIHAGWKGVSCLLMAAVILGKGSIVLLILAMLPGTVPPLIHYLLRIRDRLGIRPGKRRPLVLFVWILILCAAAQADAALPVRLFLLLPGLPLLRALLKEKRQAEMVAPESASANQNPIPPERTQ